MAGKKKEGMSFECKFLIGALIFYLCVGYGVYGYLYDDLGYRTIPDYDANPVLPLKDGGSGDL